MYGLQAGGQLGQNINHAREDQFANRVVSSSAGDMPEIERELLQVRTSLDEVRNVARDIGFARAGGLALAKSGRMR